MNKNKNSYNDDNVRNEVKLLITIILTLLLSLAFLTQFEVESQKKNDGKIFIPAALDILFLTGILIIFFSYLKYYYSKSKLIIFINGILIPLIGLFLLFYIKFFLDALNSAIGDEGDLTINLINSLGKFESSIILTLGILTIFLLAIGYIIINIIQLKNKHKERV